MLTVIQAVLLKCHSGKQPLIGISFMDPGAGGANMAYCKSPVSFSCHKIVFPFIDPNSSLFYFLSKFLNSSHVGQYEHSVHIFQAKDDFKSLWYIYYAFSTSAVSVLFVQIAALILRRRNRFVEEIKTM